MHLTDYETASEPSFLLAGSIPDDTLWTAGRPPRPVRFQQVVLDAQSRSGVLAIHAPPDGSAPMRGVFVLQSIMCSRPPPRPANVPALPATNEPIVQDSTTHLTAIGMSSSACHDDAAHHATSDADSTSENTQRVV